MGIITDKQASDELRLSLFVRDVRYSNTAAKFWPTLFDESKKDFPTCTRIELTAPTADTIKRKYLYPAAMLGEMNSLLDADMEKVANEVMAELKMFGPPAPVSIKLYNEEQILVSRNLPLDCMDAELMTYLIVWLLEWAGVPDPLWNSDYFEGSMIAEDRQRSLLYDVPFMLQHRHMHEGLYQRSISLSPIIQKLDKQPASTVK